MFFQVRGLCAHFMNLVRLLLSFLGLFFRVWVLLFWVLSLKLCLVYENMLAQIKIVFLKFNSMVRLNLKEPIMSCIMSCSRVSFFIVFSSI